MLKQPGTATHSQEIESDSQCRNELFRALLTIVREKLAGLAVTEQVL
jgi:hypothetical protein